MSGVLSAPETPVPTVAPVVVPRNWKTPVVLVVFSVLFALVVLIAHRRGETTFRLSTGSDAVVLPDFVVPVAVTAWVSIVASVLLTALAAWYAYGRRRVPLWLISLYILVIVFGFLAWAAAGKTLPIPGLLAGSLALAVPLIYGALGGVIGERVGVVNIAIESQLLGGAFCAAVVATLTGSPTLGLLAAMVAGAAVGAVLAAFAIVYFVEQVIIGVVLNVLVAGLTSFLYSQVLQPNAATLNTPPRFDRLPIPLLSDIPIIGPVFFRQTFLVYLMYALIVIVSIAMFRTRWGLRMRAVGEHPKAADTVGIDVGRTRFVNVMIAGAIAGAGGTVFTVGNGIAFNQEMTAGAGYIALAAVIFGQWHPIKATLAALLFGFASNLQNTLKVVGSPVPSEFMLMLPYLVTIFVVAGVVGKSRAPAADGIPYIKS
ncbi:ABC transporter permease [Microbacterium pseudoresistens]|uniref:Simple sugar transport system permease protein n=1 Tax=Microbacterium pseudoresistens TaxID=640634 RepID=A0A7Y9EVQ2_9MICO|nr:ABC transporter permease [Microbacterium pseudoresistens]NYD54838.1 simple sugar transport system permease protein [Microbacterium pseudoresistens]